jgi:hypothetical protein
MARDVAPGLSLIAVRDAAEGAVSYAQLRERGEVAAEGTA